ncbi:MAG TPA: hypothetical protein VFH38_01140 [Jatrophihabitans sp.]|nr:hypothetical protein [Jatrophihabitans sp.]
MTLPFALTAAFSQSAGARPNPHGPHTALPGAVHWTAAGSKYAKKMRCPQGPLCTEIYRSPRGGYVGHDEPALNFYSGAAGSGNNVWTTMTLPKDATTKPSHGGVPNFEQHVAFWFGMAMCDNQSAPNPGGSPQGANVACKPNSDANAFTSNDPSNPKYIGLHPGVAFMEMQFYPPGWVDWPAGDSCAGQFYCAALNIDSLNENYNTGQINNNDCLNKVGIEPANFAFITKNGVATGPANPLDATAATYTPDPTQDLFMKPGDRIKLHMFDTSAGFKVVIKDLTAGTQGSMTASAANGFGAIDFAPNAASCTVTDTNFHPAYATSSPKTRVPWAAHSYNVGYSDEIGHFEHCDPGAISGEGGDCFASSDDPEDIDPDNNYCFDAAASSLYKVTGCYGEDSDFDGPPYDFAWPGTGKTHAADVALHGTPVTFTGLRYGSAAKRYSRVAFEADLPRIESLTTPPCQRHVQNPRDASPGAGCRGLPAGASFYPIFTTHKVSTGCVWQEGGTKLPNTTNTFGGSSRTEFGNRLKHIVGLPYPSVGGGPVQVIYEDYRHILSGNPC